MPDKSPSPAAGRLRRAARVLTGRDAPPPAAPARSAAPARPAGQKAAAQPAPGVDPRFARSQARIGRAVLGPERFPKTDDPDVLDATVFEQSVVEDIASTARWAGAGAVLAQRLATGAPFDEAVMDAVRALAAVNRRPSARGLVLSLDAQLGTHLTDLGLGLVLCATSDFPRAWAFLAGVPTDELARLAPVEATTAALAVDTPESVAVARDIGARGASYDVETLVDLAGRFVATGHHDLASALVTEARGRDTDGVATFYVEALDNLGRWVDPRPPVTTSGVTLGIIDYHHPDYERASSNVGDYIQTLAMLGNLARFQQTRYSGADGLGELMGELQGRVKSGLRIDGGDADVTVLPVSRDFSTGDDLPEDTWTLVFGWHLHSTFRIRFGLPYHPRVNPLFVAFHVNRENALTPDALEWMRAHGPVGCRDWTSVYLLLSAGVDAFFTGCLTTTVDAVFPETSEVNVEAGRRVGAIDVPLRQARKIKRPKELVTHGGDEHRLADLATGVRAASDMLDTYQRRYSRIVTSRLHSYLPATSLGLEVRFKPPIAGDVRFDGLYGMLPDNEPFVAMRDDMRELIAGALELVLSGADRDAVYAHWRAVTADRVAEARERMARPTSLEIPELDLDAALAVIATETHRYGPDAPADAVDVAMSLDQNLAAMFPVTVESMLANASGPVRLWVTARGLGPAYRQWFSDQFPTLPVTFLGMDHVDYGEIGRLIPHTSIATMDRLLLPEVLRDLDRITYVDIDTVVEGDIRELAAVDLQGHPLAARTTFESAATLWHVAGDLLSAEHASELRRTMFARHPFNFRSFNAGVLVLDLARMRADGFCRELVPFWAGCFGLHDQDILNAYVGPDRLELDPRWNALPIAERVVDPGVVHFAGKGKPWESEVVPEGARWARYARAFAERAARMPDPQES